MSEAMKPVWLLLKITLILAVAAYPITFIIQLFSGSINPFSTYNQMLASVFMEYWDWILVIIISFLFMRSDILFKSVEHIRKRHYELEFLRWKNTPYIAPLHLLYLLSPPGATTDDKKSNAFDDMYKTVIADFRERIYINAKFSSVDPEAKPSLRKILGQPLFSQLVVNTIMIIFGVVGMLNLNPSVNELFSGWGKAFIPLEVLFLSRTFKILNAIRLAHPSKTYQLIVHQFGMEEPRVTWRELFPDSPYGESILFAWRADCEKRQRLAYELSGKTVPVKMEFKSTGLAPPPFPSKEIPEWTDQMVQSLEAQQAEWRSQIDQKNKVLEQTSNGKIIAFRNRG
ncbi:MULTISPECIES: hypothetical protein [unclassified Paenibacillus]|uniref:Uncharacterized protein n=1 Tax=Paenibacillus provencensis TaxID=441151 RepID=A0ABW3PYZ0_9BACL|nr:MULTISPECIES: hypothetical protein [unclassified Paenibacillus]MCM3130155.1 hypothetical protein [Paenibacillus sp. MER 78]SDX70679.1 hypothetical protein SAMN05518848_11243 [Paenibacillus sp. PDC88]SFS88233.1 hypothetical protein SAMN04488601_10639 [Paenibacillus sp. 453mf]